MKVVNCLLPIVCLSWSTAALADDSGVVFAGATINDGFSTYAGAVVALPGARLGKGIALRGTVNGGRYNYLTDGTRIEGEYVGGDIALVYQTSGKWGWANFSAGGRVTDTSLSPNDPSNVLGGTRYDLALQTDGSVGESWRLRWFGSLGVLDETYIVQASLARRIRSTGETYAGIEVGLQGDPKYTAASQGLFVETPLGGRWQGRLSGGLSEQAGRSVRPYASVSLSHVF